MIRFPNPGSDISGFVRSFQAIFRHLGGLPHFSLDDISRALIESNLATSSGHIGKEALRRSTRKDRSLDPLFNQSKMYSELFRTLGWIHSAQDDRQKFSFTLLGAHVGLDPGEPTALVKECLIGLAYPNPHVEIKGEHHVRPIACILRAASALDGKIYRDEIIIGPQTIRDDRDQSEFSAMIARLKKLRGRPGGLVSELERFAEHAKVQVNTLHNYTRFPLGTLRWAGWTKGVRDKVGVADTLTEEATKTIARINASRDFRPPDLKGFPQPATEAFLQLAFYRMMERSGYSLDKIAKSIPELELASKGILARFQVNDSRLIIHSPFQECDVAALGGAFPGYQYVDIALADSSSKVAEPMPKEFSKRPQVGVDRILLKQVEGKAPKQEADPVIQEIVAASRKTKDLDQIVRDVFEKYRGSSKATFYPAVAALFRTIGFDCQHSRIGVNCQRMDALITDKRESIPIEIKSPNEQEFLSVKAVRQALENKIVLLARKHAPTLPETTSLAVGYEPPNNRSEVSGLIEDIHDAFHLSIGVIDFRSLVLMAATRLLQGKAPPADAIRRLRGLIEVAHS